MTAHLCTGLLGQYDSCDCHTGCQINAYNDHRIAMSFTCLGLASERAIQINGANSIHTSFPNFVDLMHSIGACINIAKNKP